MESKVLPEMVDPEFFPETSELPDEGLAEKLDSDCAKNPPGTGTGSGRAPCRRKAASRQKSGRPHARNKNTGTPYPFDFRLRLVKLHIEEGIGIWKIATETGISPDTMYDWVGRYRAHGEAGLHPNCGIPRAGRQQLPVAVKTAIMETKRAEPTWGIKKISQFMKRMLHLPGSPETVRRTLHAEQLIVSKPPRPAKMPTKPRFFERATPNQMWQSDIFTFRLGGKNAYLIGFIDDYSRFITSLGLFRSQTAEHVLETYRRGVGEYGVPREMLTDNGRQYTAWRGKTKFEQELKKDKVHHLRSQPHHPMTLGKIERFWQNINGEFLSRAQFDSFEQAVERVALWVKHYNHRRPHQGIGGMCPADRFFEVRNDLRKVIERGIEDNLLEIALRGKPQRPFYMVGRVDGQSVVMQASKGKLVMTVGDRENNQQQEVLCDLDAGKVAINENDNGEDGEEDQGDATEPVHGGGQMPGGAGAVDGAQFGDGTVPGSGSDLEPAQPLAGTGDGGDGPGAGAETVGPLREYAAESAPAGTAGTEGGAEGDGDPGPAVAGTETGPATESPQTPIIPASAGPAMNPESGPELTPELVARVLNLLACQMPAVYGMTCHADTPTQGGNHAGNLPDAGRTGPAPGPVASGRAVRENHGDPGGGNAEGLAQDLARMAAARPGSHAASHERPAERPAAPGTGSGKGTAPRPAAAEGAADHGDEAKPPYPERPSLPSAAGTWHRQ
jgi:transposase InsO family protein